MNNCAAMQRQRLCPSLRDSAGVAMQPCTLTARPAPSPPPVGFRSQLSAGLRSACGVCMSVPRRALLLHMHGLCCVLARARAQVQEFMKNPKTPQQMMMEMAMKQMSSAMPNAGGAAR